jgi:hypothetical protein
MRYPFDVTGTIGSKPCEISLNRILAELNDPRLTRNIMRCINRCKNGLKALKSMPDKHWRACFRNYLQEICRKNVEKITGVQVKGVKIPQSKGIEAVASHTMCCLHAYFAEFINGSKEKEVA